MEEKKISKPKSRKKLLAIIVVIILIITGIFAFLYVNTAGYVDHYWVFSQSDILVNRTITDNITKEVIVDMDDWADIYHEKYHIDKLYISIGTWINNTETFLFNLSVEHRQTFDESRDENIPVPDSISVIFENNGMSLSEDAFIQDSVGDWMIRDDYPNGRTYSILDKGNMLEVHLPPSEYGEYSHHDKLSAVMGEHDYPVTFFDVDGDSYLSIGDYFLTNPAIISEEFFDGLYFNLLLEFDSHNESIQRWDISEEDQYQYYKD